MERGSSDDSVEGYAPVSFSTVIQRVRWWRSQVVESGGDEVDMPVGDSSMEILN